MKASLLFIAVMLSAVQALAATSVSLEDEAAWVPASASLSRAVLQRDRAAYQDCLPFQMSAIVIGGDVKARLITTSPKCWGSSAGSMWLVSQDDKPRILLEDGGFTVEVIASKPQAMPELRVQYGNAGHCGIRVWQYNSVKGVYSLKKTARCL